ncbi:MAG: hypothetical protein JSS93_04405 [Bacteroidetes bacterium]|nr:hypothetical protein [Bacteroidota bacterium]
MDSERIETLLEKYWNAETSLEEENELYLFFQTCPASEKWNEAAELFRYLHNEKKKTMQDPFFDQAVTKQTGQRPKGKTIRMRNGFQIMRIAAGILVMVAAVYLIGMEVRKNSPQAGADTETDPQRAFEETKKALLMISRNFNKAQQEVGKINLLNEAEQKIRNKPTTPEQEIKD